MFPLISGYPCPQCILNPFNCSGQQTTIIQNTLSGSTLILQRMHIKQQTTRTSTTRWRFGYNGRKRCCNIRVTVVAWPLRQQQLLSLMTDTSSTSDDWWPAGLTSRPADDMPASLAGLLVTCPPPHSAVLSVAWPLPCSLFSLEAEGVLPGRQIEILLRVYDQFTPTFPSG